ncbi:asparagine synthase [Gigaspora margarita]|uniref:Asparagine synthase n=1 Tax=Gigaspora margarita TaxID=4874 RepID=A0A8H4B0F7_GIGMA|nr:asparagine synthase [Gigaspora margarita]
MIDPEEKMPKEGTMEKIDSLRDINEKFLTDEQLANAFKHWSKGTSQTKEAYWYRDQFESYFQEIIVLKVF